MATSLQNLVCDSSTLANFKSWAQAISTFISGTAGWTQSSDTGQVNWSTIGSVPGSGAYVYEIWQPADSLTAYYLKIEYGNFSGQTNQPTIRLSIAQATNGAGTLSGTVLGPFATNCSAFTAPSASTTYECRFSGDTGRLQILMWRLGGNLCCQAFSVERSLNASGVYTGSHVTLSVIGFSGNNTPYAQQTLVFGSGLAPAPSIQNGSSNQLSQMPCRFFETGRSLNAAFNSFIPMDTIAPMVGFWDYPLTGFGTAPANNISEGQVFTTTLYGSARTYVATYSGDIPYGTSCRLGNISQPLLVRYD